MLIGGLGFCLPPPPNFVEFSISQECLATLRGRVLSGGSLGAEAAVDGCDAHGVGCSAVVELLKSGTGGSCRGAGGAGTPWAGLMGVEVGVTMGVEGCEVVDIGGSLGAEVVVDGCDAHGVGCSDGNEKGGTGGSCRLEAAGAASRSHSTELVLAFSCAAWTAAARCAADSPEHQYVAPCELKVAVWWRPTPVAILRFPALGMAA